MQPLEALLPILQRTPGMRSIEKEVEARQTETYGVLIKGVLDNSVDNLARCVDAICITEGRNNAEVQRAYAKQKDGAKHGRAWAETDATDDDGPGYYQGEVAVFFTAERRPQVPAMCTVHQNVDAMDVDTTAERARGEYTYIARDMCLQCGAHAPPGHAIPPEAHAQECPRRPKQAATITRPTRDQIDEIIVHAKQRGDRRAHHAPGQRGSPSQPQRVPGLADQGQERQNQRGRARPHLMRQGQVHLPPVCSAPRPLCRGGIVRGGIVQHGSIEGGEGVGGEEAGETREHRAPQCWPPPKTDRPTPGKQGRHERSKRRSGKDMSTIESEAQEATGRRGERRGTGVKGSPSRECAQAGPGSRGTARDNESVTEVNCIPKGVISDVQTHTHAATHPPRTAHPARQPHPDRAGGETSVRTQQQPQ